MSPDPTPDLGVPVKTDPAELLLDLLTSPDGCPGWQPTDPPPSAEVPRG